MIFAFGDDGMIGVHGTEADVQREWEGLDVESQAVVFYDERGTWLKPEFTTPNTRSLFGLVVGSGHYRLIPTAKAPPEIDPIDVALSEAAGVTPNPHFESVDDIRRHIHACRSARA